jgi:hypothetical protein
MEGGFDPALLAQMKEFGFEEEKSKLALLVAGGEIEYAINLAADNTEE